MAGRGGEFVINLRRNNLNTPWGFRLQGGKEFNTYLSIQRVFNGSPSDGHLQRGDVIVAIDNENVSEWHQKTAQDLIQSIGLTLVLAVRRGGSVPYAEERQAPSQVQPVPSFVRKPFGQQPAQSFQQQQQLSPQMTSKATLQFQPSPYSPTHPTNDLENTRPSAAVTWSPHSPSAPAANSFSTPLQVRTAQPPQKSYSSYSPQQGESFGQGQGQPTKSRAGLGQAPYQQDYGGGERVSYGREPNQWDAVQSSQQPNYDESNHVNYDRNQQQIGGSAPDSRPEPVYNEGRKEGEEEDDFQQLTVRDIKQMFNKPDQKGHDAPVSRIKGSPKSVGWTKPEGPISPGGYGASGLRPGQPSSLTPARPTTGSIQRGPPPSDDFRKSYSPTNYGQSRYASPPKAAQPPAATATVNKLGGSFAGIIQPALPQKTAPAPKSAQKGAPQKKKEFDPNQSAVYKILLEEEERAKNQPHQKEDEEEEAPRKQAQGQRQPQRQAQVQRQPQNQQQGSRLTELLEKDEAQLAPFKEEPRPSYQEPRAPYQEPRAPHQEPRAPYQEPRVQYQEPRAPYQEPRAPYQEPRAPYQEPRSPYQEPRSPYQEPRAMYQEPSPSQSYATDVPQSRGPPRGVQGARQAQPTAYSSYDSASAFPQTQYVDGIPTSDF